MNDRIKELLLKAGWDEYEALDERNQKFAELIVLECEKVAMRSVDDDEPKEAWYLIQEHFGVEE